MSALVIQSHVKEGLTLAKRHKLPRRSATASAATTAPR
jgi:membrane-associated HD superfamily phosphohydrolase